MNINGSVHTQAHTFTQALLEMWISTCLSTLFPTQFYGSHFVNTRLL